MRHTVYLSPGMFGFGRLASYDYFTHVQRELSARMRVQGMEVVTHVTHVFPTASIRRRALTLAELVADTCGGSDRSLGPIHLVGHSTGGLDARLVASPTVALALPPEKLAWRARLASVTTMNAPHFGTPLATFFTTASGQRALRALSVLTVLGLSFGSAPLAIARALVAAFRGVDRSLGLKIEIFDRATQSLMGLLDGVRSSEVRDYVKEIGDDQGAMVQLMPEAMDLFVAGIEDRPGVLYQSTVSMAPPVFARTRPPLVRHPWTAASAAVFGALYAVTSQVDPRYPCAAVTSTENERALAQVFGRLPEASANDGVVPIGSQIWGRLVWAGLGDHLDVLGHFYDAGPPKLRTQHALSVEPPHVDWLFSGSGFGRRQFASLMDAITDGMMAGAR